MSGRPISAAGTRPAARQPDPVLRDRFSVQGSTQGNIAHDHTLDGAAKTASGTGAAAESITAAAIAVLALLGASPSFSTDLYLAGFPQIGAALETSASGVQLSLTGYLIGVGVGQLVWGPVSDKYGRRRPLLLGGALCVLTAAAAALAPTVEILIIARFLQAVAGAAGLVLGRAIILDRMEGFQSARALSLVATLTSTAPIAAPVFGGALLGLISWRGVLGVLVLIAMIQLLGVTLTQPESLPEANRQTRVRFTGLVSVLGRPSFLGFSLTRMWAFGAVMAYIAASPYVYQELMGLSSLTYSVCFAINAVGMVTGNLVSARLSRRRIHPGHVVAIALPLVVASTVCVLVVACLPVAPRLLMVPLFTTVLSAGFVMGNLTALAMNQVRDRAGTGSSVLGALMFLFGGLVSPVAGLGGGNTAVPLAVTMVACASSALVCFVFAQRYIHRRPHLDAAFRPVPERAGQV